MGAALGPPGEAGVGETVLRAVQDTRRWVAVNTNLGIVLLLAPLARAAAGNGAPLRSRLSRVLATLTVADAQAVYAAIRLADPGGLGQVEAQDVREEPTVTLREAMALAAERDTIAREYVTDYDVTFGLAVPALQRVRACGLGWPAAALESYLRVLAEVPDTLIARKRGTRGRACRERARQGGSGCGRTGESRARAGRGGVRFRAAGGRQPAQSRHHRGPRGGRALRGARARSFEGALDGGV